MPNLFALVSGGALAAAVLLSAGRAADPVATRAAEREGPEVNACGCYRDAQQVCMCLKKSSCGCPGDCEPLGCEEKRQQDLARRMELELQKIRDDERARSRDRGQPDAGSPARAEPDLDRKPPPPPSG